MIRRLLFLFLFALPLYAQNARKDDIATQLVTQNTSAGTVSFLKPVAGAVITIGLGASPCSITNTPSGSTASCAPLASICSSSTDVVCTQPNPTNADALGNYGFWAKPARYQVAVTGIGVNGKLITYDLPVGLSDLTDFVYLTELVLNGGTPLVGQTGTGTSIVTNTGPTITNPTISGIGPRFQQFTANGTFSIPPNVTVVKAIVVGAGGGGGGGTAVANTAGGGGACGGYSIKYLSGLTPGNTLTVTVGLGGTGVSGGTGNVGGVSSVSSGTQTIATITANGGGGGIVSGGNGTALGGIAGTGGDFNFPGTSPSFNGFNGNTGGNGASSFLGGFGLGAAGASSGGAANGFNVGGGGGGSGIGNTTGGSGSGGIVIFEWVI